MLAAGPQPERRLPASRRIPALPAISGLSARDAKKLDRFSLLAVAAARLALQEAGLSQEEIARCGVVSGNMMAGWTFTEAQLRALHQVGTSAVSPYLATAWFPAAPQGQITIHLKMRGFAKTVTTDRCGGAQSIGLAFERIRNGRSDLLLAGGAEAPVTPFIEAAWANLGRSPHELTEAAAYLLLARREEGDTGPAVGAHATFPLPSGHDLPVQAVAQRIAAFLHALPDAPPVSHAVCNVVPDATVEQEVAQILKEALGQPAPSLLFPTRITGDCLAASGAIAAVVAYTILLQTPPPCSVLVLSIGHQCGDLLWMT